MKITVLLALCAIAPVISIDAQELLWPMAGKKAGDNILYKPQAHIDNELVFDELFIGGEEGDVVISPASGIISTVSVCYRPNLNESISYDYDDLKTFDENIAAAVLKESINGKDLHISISILYDNKYLYINGLKGQRRFKTGEKIAAGDTLGLIGHSYDKIKTPSISISISKSHTLAIDPMSPFGLESTYKAPEELKRDNPMSAEKIREDLEVLKLAFIELYPSLELHMTKDAWSAYIDSIKTTITSPMDPSIEFRLLLREILHKTSDSHLALLEDPIRGAGLAWYPSEILSLCDDTVRVAATTLQYSQYLWRIVTHVNGEPVMKYVEERKKYLSRYDEQVESTTQEDLLLMMQSIGKDKETKEHILTFDDSTTVSIPLSANNRIKTNAILESMFNWRYRNRRTREDDFYETRELNDSASFLGIKTFNIPDQQVEEIGQYLATCKSNLIIDVRNNAGGESKVLYKILSFLTDKPMNRQKGGYHWVSKKGRFDMLKYCLNHSRDEELFMDYEQREDGCYKDDPIEALTEVKPDSVVNYKGRIYVLTNGGSFSAAMIFPSVLVRNRRGVSVGRETGSAYHRMACFESAEIQLPNTLQPLSIPLVLTVFDTTRCERVPIGRGLLPDYPMPLTFYEITDGADGNTDVMLDYTLKLIADGKYLSATDPFEESDREEKEEESNRWWRFALVIAVTLVTIWGAKAMKTR